MKPVLPVYYCFPRSGGTLVNQCLLCDPRTVVLSEVNPAGSVVEPEIQASEWFGLFDQPEAEALAREPYLNRIDFIVGRAGAVGRKLCIRDWVGVNFLPAVGARRGTPSQVLEQRAYLHHAGYTLREIAILRRSYEVYTSLRTNVPELADLPESEFAACYEAYLTQIQGMPKFWLDMITEEPRSTIQTICRVLSLDYAEDFAERFHAITTVTGNSTLVAKPASSGWTTIRNRTKNPANGKEPELFRQLDTLAGYVAS